MATVRGTGGKRAGTEAASKRLPQQERGERRVQSILDAAAELIAEGGVVAATVHGIARRSGTAIGSMYHFFPDRDAVLRALAERHVGVIEERLTARLQAESGTWRSLTTTKAIDRFVDPILVYIGSNPDILSVMQETRAERQKRGGKTTVNALMHEMANTLIVERCPGLDVHERNAAATAIVGVIDGILGRATAAGGAERSRLLAELKRVLVGYLRMLERAAKAGAEP